MLPSVLRCFICGAEFGVEWGAQGEAKIVCHNCLKGANFDAVEKAVLNRKLPEVRDDTAWAKLKFALARGMERLGFWGFVNEKLSCQCWATRNLLECGKPKNGCEPARIAVKCVQCGKKLLSNSTQIRCKHCGALNVVEPLPKCPSCGQTLQPMLIPPSMFCSRCSVGFSDPSFKYCPHCALVLLKLGTGAAFAACPRCEVALFYCSKCRTWVREKNLWNGHCFVVVCPRCGKEPEGTIPVVASKIAKRKPI